MKTDIQTELTQALRSHEKVWANEEKTILAKNILLDLVEKTDPAIIGLLLENDELKRHFFAEVNGVLVFKLQDFRFFLDKHSINNSYTKYANRIGLMDGNRFLKDSSDIVLDFPFKDCVLNGGQSTEEGEEIYFKRNNNQSDSQLYTKLTRKRQEIFFNQTLAFDEIDRLFDAKAFSKFSRHTADGKQAVGEIKRRSDGTPAENLIIKGNNLIALHSLAKQFKGKVKLIYIDPPYNTGNDGFKYNDKFNHSTWLTFMKNRLEIAKTLLADDGVIFVQCDDNEQAYLKILMDEVFGRENFVTTIHCQMSTTQGMKVKAAQDGNIVKNAEYIIVFSKNGHKNIAINPLYDLRSEYDEHYSLYLKNDGAIGQLKELYDYRFPKDLKNTTALSLKEAFKKSNEFAEIVKTHLSKIVRSDKVTGFDLSVELENSKWKEVERNGRKYILTLDKNGKVCQLLRLQDSWGKTDNYNNDEGLRKIRGNWWEGFYLDMGNVGKEGSVDFKNGKKGERLISQIIKTATNENDIILDYHLGSGTTAAVAHKMNRQYIGIEQMDYIETLAVERMKKVIDGEQGGISKAVNWQGGGEFVYAELAPFNETAKQQILACENSNDIKTLFEDLCERYFLKYNVSVDEFSQIIEEPEFQSLPLDEQKQMMLEMLDLNQMYVSLSEMDDEQFTGCLNDDDKALSRAFYQAEKKDGE
ncbi:TPA: DNA methyltransferase [Haemophilus influenzae]|uniref:site-specific DNA-methyltransferase (adenine-specific) n=1 Tax=Haemophilus influenzae TaxID=727 RepID=A0ABD6WPG6_HAEIF|nr:site-specific DNA-methyltransferase [Haemophilus influenzae]MCK8983014.1 site-specific DNA-methyltransferase [Haemophilus influenzae]MCK9027507.1 site-specific DNA-methyltransferase [Haemophilus influenzae]PRL90163.1 Modification methylase MboII [Haemophilus influenzae]PRL90247.1 Modification methylase MboII [Haemophilus influenzae]